MEKVMNPYDKEYMKMAMLKHEETFKHQVYELHRLYRIQKTLMKSIEKENQPRIWNSNHLHIEESNGEVALEIEESEIQLTLGPTNYHRRKNVGTPRTSDSVWSFSSSSTGSNHMRRTNSGTHQKTETSGRKNSFGVEEQLNQDRLKQSPWLFQPLSLKFRT